MNRLIELGRAGARVLLVGPPGCAKTGRIAGVADALGRRLIVSRVSLTDRLDWAGALVPDSGSGVCRQLPLESLRELQTTTEPVLLLLDDLGQAPMDAQAALMRLFDEGGLSDSVLVWAATNRPGDKAGVSALCEPLRSRFDCAFAIATPEASTDGDATYLQPWADEVAGWVEWAMDNGASPEVIAWHRATSGRTLYQWKACADPALRMPDFRSWGSVVKLWAAGVRDLGSLGAVIGKPAAAEFLAFARLSSQLPTPDQVWLDPAGAVVPSDPSACYLISSMLAAAVEGQHAGALMTYVDRLPRVYGALLARDSLRKLGASLSGRPEWVKWFNANQELFTA